MRKASIEITFNKFFGDMVAYGDLLQDIYFAEHIVADKREKIQVYEAFVSKIHAGWEILVEDLLIDCLNRDTSKYAEYIGRSLPKHLTKAQCEAMICGLGYFDFRGISHIKKIALDILVEKNNPFQTIKRPASDKIEEFYKIRNYLTHYSSVAKRALTAVYVKSYGIKKFRDPGDFLICMDRRNKQTRLHNYIETFIKVGIGMADFLDYKREFTRDKWQEETFG